MIKSFKCRETRKIFNRESSSKLPASIQGTAMRKLWMVAAADSINDLRIPPANHLEKLRGKKRGQHSIRINDQWRICFKWHQQDAYEVEIIDYHK
ncbi:type II toxin-antitoxin system RelE/ParE family toxin [Patescibacteria group bacterium]|nr:type II toxin-antitoxin system RelE/ParE family toxin [Patescibacteria group bacterium]